MSDLIIVESPAKAKTIEKYLGKEYKVTASKGHIIDLPKSGLGVEVEDGFKPEYSTIPGKQQVISGMKKMLPEKGVVYIASDPDREGEAIGWHVARSLGLITDTGKAKKVRGKDLSLKRIVFHEITKTAILESFSHARDIDMNLVDAQQARRVLDRLVGYKLSPLLWTKIRYGLSAGRVQSVAVKLIVDRERERDAFHSEEYWSIEGLFLHPKGKIAAQLRLVNGKKVEIHTGDESNALASDIKKASYHIQNVTEKQVRRHPSPPFITSTLQQEANRKLGFSAKQTMMLAQKLYEGIEKGKERIALITYMRTDSYNLSAFALEHIRGYIKEEFGNDYLPQKVNLYKKKSKLAQEAHEAIRPVDVTKTPSLMAGILNRDELRLYELIWKRSVASQMSDALFNALTIDIEGGVYNFRATGQTVSFPGFIKLYIESKSDDEAESGKEFMENILPDVEKKDSVKLDDLKEGQHFTQPPARYSEATLVKALEENGIGRPSTYAPIISTIIARGYVEKEGKYFKPQDVGYVVNDLLSNHFSKIVDIGFTSHLEEELDDIAEGKRKYATVLSEFYTPFITNLELKTKEIKKEDVVNLGESNEICPDCKGKMVIKLGRYGKFLSCTNFPDCKGMKSLDDGETPELTDEKCEKCQSPLVVKMSKKGVKFLACSKYPACDFTKSFPTGKTCEKCGAELVLRKSKWGKTFYGCSRYPECKFILGSTSKKVSEGAEA